MFITFFPLEYVLQSLTDYKILQFSITTVPF